MQPLPYQQTSGFSPTAVINRSQTKQVPGHEKIRDAVRAWSAVDNQDVVATLIVNEYREQGGGTIDFPDDVSRARQKLFRFLDNKFDSEKYRNNVRELTRQFWRYYRWNIAVTWLSRIASWPGWLKWKRNSVRQNRLSFSTHHATRN